MSDFIIRGGLKVPKIENVKQYEKDMVSWRRDFHMHPEIGFEEFRTSKIIIELLKKFGCDEVIEGFSKTSVIGVLKSGSSKKVIALRADIDALSMPDLKDVEYKSLNDGTCHSCGHDAHTAVALGAAKYFSENRDKFDGTIKFVFQAAEEGPDPGGAFLIMESGMLDDVDIMIGGHTHPDYKAGTVAFKDGALYASGSFFRVTVSGLGGHGAYPHQTKDSLIAATQMVQAIQNIISREIDPLGSAVISVCNFHSGDALNVIPESASFGGTIRTLDMKINAYIEEKINSICEHISAMNGCTCEVEIENLFPVVENDKEANDMMRQAAISVLGKDFVKEVKLPEMGSEDFSFYSQKIKSSYFLWGIANDTNCTYQYHNPRYDVDESSLCVAMAVFATTIENYLA